MSGAWVVMWSLVLGVRQVMVRDGRFTWLCPSVVFMCAVDCGSCAPRPISHSVSQRMLSHQLMHSCSQSVSQPVRRGHVSRSWIFLEFFQKTAMVECITSLICAELTLFDASKHKSFYGSASQRPFRIPVPRIDPCVPLATNQVEPLTNALTRWPATQHPPNDLRVMRGK